MLNLLFLFNRERREKDKSAIMTMVFREVPPGHPTRSPQDEIIVALDNQTKNVIHYQKVADSKRFEFPVVMYQYCGFGKQAMQT